MIGAKQPLSHPSKNLGIKAFLLLVLISCSFALTLEYPLTKESLYEKSKLDGIEDITAKEIYTEITHNASYHYYLIKTKNGVIPKPSIIAKGFKLYSWNTYEITNKESIEKEVEEEKGNKTKITKEDWKRAELRKGGLKGDGKEYVLVLEAEQWAEGSFNADVSSCGATLSSDDTTYNLITNLSCTGSNGVSITGNNVTFDCGGNNITSTDGNNYGVYENGGDATIQNCILINFTQCIEFNQDGGKAYNNTLENNGTTYALYADRCDNINLTHNKVTATGSAKGIGLRGNNQTAEYNNVTTAGPYALVAIVGTTNSLVRNNYVEAGGDFAYIQSNGENNTIEYNNFTCTSDRAVFIYNSANATNLSYNNITSPSSIDSILLSDSTEIRVVGNNISSNYTEVIDLENADDCYFTNNTINTSDDSGRMIEIDGDSSGNYFYYNTLWGDNWILDLGTNNHFNTTDAGNYYYFYNGTGAWEVYDITTTSYPTGDWADGGSDRPFNSTLAEWGSNGNDWHPWTEREPNYPPTNCTIDDITNKTDSGHSFNVTASCDDARGGATISSTTINITLGTCAELGHTIYLNEYEVTYQCNATTFGTTEFNITFTDSLGLSNTTPDDKNAYLDPNTPNFSAYITPAIPNLGDTLTCNLANFTDADEGDILNASSQTYRWFNDTGEIGITESTLNNTYFGEGENITCEIYAQAQNWTSSNYTDNSSSVEIQNIEINTSIIYPAESSLLGMAISDCNLTITIQTNDSATGGASRSSNIFLYSRNSSAGASWTLLDNYSSSDVNASHIFKIPADFENTSMLANATITVSGVNAYTQNVTFDIMQTTFCTGGEDADNAQASEGSIIFLGMGIIILAGYLTRHLNAIQATVLSLFIGIGAVSQAIAEGSASGATDIMRYIWVLYAVGIFAWFAFLFWELMQNSFKAFSKQGY